MSAKNLLDQIQIKTPCSADWNSMIGNDQVRFCEHCSLTVHNLSQMTRKRALRLVTGSKGRLCVRYHSQTVMPQRLHQMGRRISRLAASAFTATLTVSSAVAQPSQTESSQFGESNISSFKQGAFLELEMVPTGTISGTLVDAHDAVIQGATITLGNEQTRYLLSTTSDSEGQYRFEQLPPGTYSLTIEAPGFAKHEVTQIVLADHDSQRFDQTLEVAGIQANVEVLSGDSEVRQVTMGAVAIAEPADPFVKAALEDDLQAVQALLTTSNVNLRDKATGTTPLEYAVGNGNREMVQILLSAGADVNDRNSEGQTVLMMLREEGTSDIAWDLINAGAKVNLKDKEGDTALIEAAGCHNLAVLTALLQAGAKVEARNEQGQTALMMAASNGLTANVRALINAGADLNARDKDRKTVLDYAKENNQEKVVKLLQSYGALAGEAVKEK